jgi:hypothetical protein
MPPSSRREFVKQSLAAFAAVAAGGNAHASASGNRVPSAVPPVAPPVPSPNATYLADFERCGAAVASEWRANHWKLFRYEADGVGGTMMVAGQNTAVRDASYPLEHRGWFAISFGLLSKYAESRLEVRLERERTFCLLTHHDMAGAGLERRDIELGGHLFTTNHIDELFWKNVELKDGDAIVFRQLKVQVDPENEAGWGNRYLPCWVAYVKLMPLTPAEVEKLHAEQRDRSTRRLFAHNDSFGSTSWLRFREAADIRREIEPYRDTDFSRMYWESAMGDVTYYPSNVGSLFTLDWMKDHYRLRDRLVGETFADFRARGIDPFKVALEYCHEIGLEFHAAYRVAGFYFPPPEEEWNRNGLYLQHPEWRGVDRSGAATPRLSYAFPGVREFVLRLLRETMQYEVDGICLLYNRRMPLLEYEAPVVDSFRAAHGLDPRNLPDDDPRWLAHRAQFLTNFMKEVRALAREEAMRQRRPKPFHVTAVVLSSLEENLREGIDLPAWVESGLVDTLVPYSSVAGLPSDRVSWADPREFEPFLAMTRGTSCEVVPNLMPRQIAADDYRRRAHALYQAGVRSLFLWDCYQRNNFDASWSALRRLGHREELAAWHHAGAPASAPARTALRRIGDWDLRYRTPG